MMKRQLLTIWGMLLLQILQTTIAAGNLVKDDNDMAQTGSIELSTYCVVNHALDSLLFHSFTMDEHIGVQDTTSADIDVVEWDNTAKTRLNWWISGKINVPINAIVN